MDGAAKQILASIRGSGVPVEVKLKQLAEIKAEIKHRHCPEAAVAPLFDIIRIALATPHLTDAGFSILGHLTKRLELQDQSSLLQAQGAKTYHVLLDRLADPKDRIRQRATQVLIDFHSIASADIEQFVRDSVLTCRNPRAKEAGMHWAAITRRDQNMAFKAFVPHIVDCLEDADGSVRQTAQATIIDLFQSASLRGMNDLQKHLQQRNVRKSIVDHILSGLGVNASTGVDPTSPSDKSGVVSTKQTKGFSGSAINDVNQRPVEAPPMSVSEQEAVQLEPIFMESPKNLEETFREMHPYFEGKETEQNWLKREKSVLKMRKITKGNAPQDFTINYLACVKGLLDGILKTVNSLRTTLCTTGCHLIQDIARAVGPGLDNMVEILLQNLVKLCASTKKITAAKGNDTVTTIMTHVSYNVRLLQHIHSACQDKNVQPRSHACGWLKVIINRHAHHKSTIEYAGGLDLVEKCLKAGLVDRDPNVRESMRPTYWAFARRWPEKSEAIMCSLDERNQKALINHSANPNPDLQSASQPVTAGGKNTFSQSTSSVPARQSIKETIAAQKKATKVAGRNLPSRPGSAEPFGSPKKSTSQMNMSRPATAMSNASRNVSTTSVGTLSSAPVRPRRRADIARPATADPHANRKPTKTETPPRSPAVSPVKRVKTPAPNPSMVKLASKRADSPAAGSPIKGYPLSNKIGNPNEIRPFAKVQTQISPTKAAEDFTMVMPHLNPSRSMENTPFDSSPHSVRPTPRPKTPKLDDPFSPSLNRDLRTLEHPEKQHAPNGTVLGDQTPDSSPTKLAGELNRLSIADNKNQRISMSPRALGSRKEALMPKGSYTQEERSLKVYEDPVLETTKLDSYPSPLTHSPRALEELPVNEPTKNRQVPAHALLAEEPQSPHYHQKWLAMEAAERQRLNSSENIDNPRQARKILDSGISRLKAKTLDVHGFRKLQGLIRTSTDALWEDGYKFDELILPLLEYMETSNEEATPRPGKVQDLKAQGLVTIRLLLQHQSKYFSGYYPRAITAILVARKYYNSASHIVCGLEEIAESIVHQCDPLLCIDSIIELLEDHSNTTETSTVSMGLYVLAGLLHSAQEKGLKNHIGEERQAILGTMGAKYLVDTNPDVRRAVIEFVLEMHDTVDQDRFWSLVTGGRDDHRSLITYYLARKRAVAH